MVRAQIRHAWHLVVVARRPPQTPLFEKNDRFFFVFAVPSAASFMLGSMYPQIFWLFFVGVGIALYGLTYFLIHTF